MFHPRDLILKQKKFAVCRTLQDKLPIKNRIKLGYSTYFPDSHLLVKIKNLIIVSTWIIYSDLFFWVDIFCFIFF